MKKMTMTWSFVESRWKHVAETLSSFSALQNE
jgi:hypothetical protein